jgi:hypothetical protein
VTTYQLATFGEPFAKQRMCINFNQLGLWVSDIRRKKGKVENKMSQEYMSGALKLHLVSRIAIPIEKMNSS